MVPFTSAQWKELERQAMIYKYMISSVPVPPHLLYPPPSCGLEAGRCKRTDGKKWRCSRDVAPHQKYCERHLHRGRGPRSRKPVEEEEEVVGVVTNNDYKYKNNGDEHQKKPRVDEQTPKHSTVRTDLTSRDLGLTVESDMAAQQKWYHLLEANMGFANEGSSLYGSSGAIFHQEDYNVDRHPSGHHHHHHVLSYSNLPTSEIGIDPPIGFTDAWSIDNLNNNINHNVHIKSSLLTNEENFSPWLNLSVAGGAVLDEEMGNVRTSDGVDFYDGDARLLLSPICREAFGPGGPLGEALCGNPHDSFSGPVTTVSSPSSGVLQRSLFSSHSDGSVCNSPSEIAFQKIK